MAPLDYLIQKGGMSPLNGIFQIQVIDNSMVICNYVQREAAPSQLIAVLLHSSREESMKTPAS